MNNWKKRGLAIASTLSVVAVALAAGISSLDSPLPVKPAEMALESALPAAHPPQGLSFSTLKTSESNGTFEALIVGGGSWLRYRHPAHTAVLVKHPQATFLFDTGLGRRVGEQFAANSWINQQLFAYRPATPAADQMDKAGWPLDSVRMIVPSHMHWDHVSGLADFPQAEVWASTEEREHAQHGTTPAFLPSQFAGVQRWHDLRLTHGPYMGYPASLDMFGDGSVVLVPLGGHTAGQVGMFLNLPSGQRYFFTGDVTWTIEGLQKPADRSWLLRHVVHLDHDEAANQSSIVHIHQIMQRYPTLKVVPAHDENVQKTLPQFPQFQG